MIRLALLVSLALVGCARSGETTLERWKTCEKLCQPERGVRGVTAEAETALCRCGSGVRFAMESKRDDTVITRQP